MIDRSKLQAQIEMEKREETLSKHPYKIWQGKDKKWYTYLPDQAKGRKMVKRATRKSVEDVIIGYWKEQQENPTIKEVFDEWNDRKLELQKISPSTHLRNTQVFNRHYSVLGKRRIKSVSPEELEDFLEKQISKHNLSAKAFSNLKTITRGFLKRAKKRKLVTYSINDILNELDVSDTDFMKTVKEDYEEVFDDEEMDKMIKYLKDNQDAKNIGILLMFVTGIRVGELVALKHSDFDGNVFKIRRTETRYLGDDKKYVREIKDFPKTQSGVRTVIIPNDYVWLCSKIKTLNPFGEFIFTDNEGNRISTQAVRMRMKRICEKLNVYHKSPHKIRKTYGTILLDNHVDNVLIIGQMGHTDIGTTENHYHRNRRTIEKKTVVLSSIPELQAK